MALRDVFGLRPDGSVVPRTDEEVARYLAERYALTGGVTARSYGSVQSPGGTATVGSTVVAGEGQRRQRVRAAVPDCLTPASLRWASFISVMRDNSFWRLS